MVNKSVKLDLIKRPKFSILNKKIVPLTSGRFALVALAMLFVRTKIAFGDIASSLDKHIVFINTKLLIYNYMIVI